MAYRTLATAMAMGVAAALMAGSASAQSAGELIGDWDMAVVTKSGPNCPSDDRMGFKVKAIEGNRLTMVLDHSEMVADYHPGSMSFRRTEGTGDRDGAVALMQGRFKRSADTVRLDLDISFPTCHVTFAALRAAPLLAGVQPPAVPAVASAPTGPSILGTSPVGPAAPAPAPAVPAPATTSLADNPLIFYAPLGLLLLAAGGLVGWLVARGRSKPDA